LDEQLISGRLTVAIVEGMEWHVLEALAKDFAAYNAEHPDEPIPNVVIDDHAADIPRLFRTMIRRRVCRVVRRRQVLRAGYALVIEQGLPLYEAKSVVAAEGIGRPLLIADRDRYDVLKAFEGSRRDYPDFRAVWFPDYRSFL
jgi:hypothetical protein